MRKVICMLGIVFALGFLFSAKAYAVVTPSVSTNTRQCGSVTMTFHNPTNFLFVFDYRVDGESAVDQSPWAGLAFNASSPLAPGAFGDRWHLVPVAGNHDQDIVRSFDANSGVHTVEYRLAEGAEQDWYFNWQSVNVQTNCNKSVVVEKQCDGTFDVAISGGDTRRTWRVGTDEKWVERYTTVEWDNAPSDVVEWKHNGVWELANEAQYVTRSEDECAVAVKAPDFDPDTRCHGTTPPAVTWALYDPTTETLNWSAVGGDKVELKFGWVGSDYPFRVVLSNDGHERVGLETDIGYWFNHFKMRVLNGCKEGSWSYFN